MQVSEVLAGIPDKDKPTRDDLENMYIPSEPPEEDLAWTDLYPKLCMWLAEYHRKRRKDNAEDD